MADARPGRASPGRARPGNVAPGDRDAAAGDARQGAPEDGSRGPDAPWRRRRDLVTAAILAESAALMIALAMPLTPSKTGSTWSMAELFWPEPTYIQEVAVYFVLTNLLIAAFALAVRVRLALRGPDSP